MNLKYLEMNPKYFTSKLIRGFCSTFSKVEKWKSGFNNFQKI